MTSEEKKQYKIVSIPQGTIQRKNGLEQHLVLLQVSIPQGTIQRLQPDR